MDTNTDKIPVLRADCAEEVRYARERYVGRKVYTVNSASGEVVEHDCVAVYTHHTGQVALVNQDGRRLFPAKGEGIYTTPRFQAAKIDEKIAALKERRDEIDAEILNLTAQRAALEANGS